MSPLKSSAPLSGREGQLRSPFTILLERLCQSCSGILGAGIVDEEGEAVDIASTKPPASSRHKRLPAYEIKLACAHFQIVLRDAKCDDPAKLRRIDIMSEHASYVAAPLPHGYVLVLIGEPSAATHLSDRALCEAVAGIATEAGWRAPASARPAWRRVRVRTNSKGAPSAVDGHDIRGPTPLPRDSTPGFEKAYSVSLEGQERTLVREPSGHWYLQNETTFPEPYA